MSLPNLIIPGVQKSGTTTLFEILKDFDQIHFARNKEPHFFSKEGFDSRLEDYSSLYSGHKKEKVVGDGSTSYFFNPEVPIRLKSTLGSDIKFIFIFREPVSRAISAYWQLYKRQVYGTTRWFDDRTVEEVFSFPGNASVAEVLSIENEKIVFGQKKNLISVGEFPETYDDPYWPFRYVSNSFYSFYLKNYLDEFPVDQMLFLTLEQLHSDPAKVFALISNFLEIEKKNFSTDQQLIFNPTYVPLKTPLLRYIHMIYPYGTKLVGKSMEGVYRKMAYVRKPSVDKELIRVLSKLYIEEIESLESLTGLELKSYWKK